MGTLHHRLNVRCALQAVGPKKQPMSQPGPSYGSLIGRCICLISNEAQVCNLEAKVKGLGIQNLTVCMGTGTTCLASGKLYDHNDLVLTSFI